MKRIANYMLVLIILLQQFLSLPLVAIAEEVMDNQKIIVDQIELIDLEGQSLEEVKPISEGVLSIDWQVRSNEEPVNSEISLPEEVTINEKEGELLSEDMTSVGSYELEGKQLKLTVLSTDNMAESGKLLLPVTISFEEIGEQTLTFDVEGRQVEQMLTVLSSESEKRDEHSEKVSIEVEEDSEQALLNETEEVELEESNQLAGVLRASIDNGIINGNLLSSFEFTLFTNNNEQIELNSGEELEVNLNEMNAIRLQYGFIVPFGFLISEGDRYIVRLPEIFNGYEVVDQPITVDDTTVATYEIIEGELIVTFSELVNNFDDVELTAVISGAFNKELFETINESIVEVPYSEGESYTALVRAKQQEYDGEDKKTAGTPYTYDDNGNKVEVTRNPTHIDWLITANDNMEEINQAIISDELDEYLEIIEDSIQVYQIKRNYNNDVIDRIPIDVTASFSDNGFDIDLGNIDDAYEIEYTTRVLRPENGGQHTIRNQARILLDNNEKVVSDDFEGTWSGDIPALTKTGDYNEAEPNIANWEVAYNYGKENLGEVTLVDILSVGEVLLETVEIVEVETDIDGNIVSKSDELVSLVPELNTDGNMVIPNLDADGKAYLITFSSAVPNGLKEPVRNEIADNIGNNDDAEVEVATIPTGGKVGEQLVDEAGHPYIEWTITLNSNKVNVNHINIKDVFDDTYLNFDVENSELYELIREGDEVTNFTISDYEHIDERTGFELTITEAGPYEYKFVYRTYYTVEGLNEPELANSAEIVFDEGYGNGSGTLEPITFSQIGPKASVSKSGKYVAAADKSKQEIEWSVVFNNSKIELENPKITDKFVSDNYQYIEGSFIAKANGEPLAESEYTIDVSDDKKTLIFEPLENPTKATYTLTYRTTADDAENKPQNNNVTFEWQGGLEEDMATVQQRSAGIDKTGEVVINDNGSKSVNWTVDFNTESNVLYNFKLKDINEPSSMTVSNIKVTKEEVEVTEDFILSEIESGQFVIEAERLDAATYQLTYTTSLSPEEEVETIRNTAEISYTGGEEKKESIIESPVLSVTKEAQSIDKGLDPKRINWRIQANDNSRSQYVHLVDAVLEDNMPEDQRLVPESIKVLRTDTETDVTDLVSIDTEDQSFKMDLPDGPYQYTITYQSEIIFYPSFNEDNLNLYTNDTILTNQTGNSLESTATDDAEIDYFYDGTSNLSTKTGEQNPDTEDVDWTAIVNPQGLTINNAKITDMVSHNSVFVEGSLELRDDNDELISSDHYDVEYSVSGFQIQFKEGTPLKTAIHLSYSTRLKENLIGSYEVSNEIQLMGGQEERTINTEIEETISQQWFYGGGGSGRTVQFELDKRNADNQPIGNAQFQLERVNINNSKVMIDSEILTNDQTVYVSGDIRAGRYILTETEAPDGFMTVEEPIYFTIGYSETGDYSYQAILTNADWTSIEDPNITIDGNRLTVINHYSPVNVVLEASKVLEGNLVLEDQQFSFELLENGEVIDLQRNDADGNIRFEELSFSETGTFDYQIREVKGEQNGITYDDSIVDVSVKVETDETGKLVRTVSYNESNPVFRNVYEAAPTEVILNAEKRLEGKHLEVGQFDFELLNSEGTVIETVSNQENASVSFTAISYDEAGVFNYSIRESIGSLGGITYDESIFDVEVTVIDEGIGQLNAEVNYSDGPAFFTNNYEAAPDQVVLEASKQLTGQTLSNGQFEFELIDQSNGEVLQKQTNNAQGQVIFEEVEFEEPGEFVYMIQEVNGNLNGVTYDERTFTIEVSVRDNGAGALQASANYIDGPASFENNYEPEPDQIVLEASKVLTGLELVNNQFSFELLDGNGDLLQTVLNNSEGQIIFEELNFESAGTYDYTIREVKGTQNGVQYDTTEYPVIVEVTDDGNGQLVASSEYTSNPAFFTNRYVPAPDSIVIEAEKRLSGQQLIDNQFTFELIDANNEVVQTVNNNAEGQIIFDEITFDTSGEFIFTIRELEGVQGGVIYDDSEYKATVSVTDNQDGNLIAEVSYDSDEVVFNNQYETLQGSAQIEASKTLTGQSLRTNQFEFNLLDENKELIQTVKNDDSGSINFDEISYTEPGEYSYFIEEVNTQLGGVTYDESIYAVTVIVTDDGNGQLVTEVGYEEAAVFNNDYIAQPDSVTINATKQLDGQRLRDDQFTFELVNEENQIIQTVKNSADGSIHFEEIRYDTAGTYAYVIREVQENIGGITYDAARFNVEVAVEDDGEGQLNAQLQYVDGPVQFTNSYTPEPSSIVLKASKYLSGQQLSDQQFEFELLDENGEVLDTVSNDGLGRIVFDEISYDEVGEYNYTIREVQGDLGGVTYDDTTYEVLVTVEDDGEGELKASTIYLSGPAQFSNEYTPEPDSVVLEATKQLEGLPLVGQQFEFELLDDSGEIIQTQQNNDLGQIVFDEISYDTVGEYHYSIREVEGIQNGITYDQTEHEVIVSVIDDGNGHLVAFVTNLNEPIVFTNQYTPAEDQVVIQAEKVLEGQNLSVDQFEFELLDQNGEVVQTTNNNADGKIIFDEISFDSTGDYLFKIREVNDRQAGIDYDSSEFDVKIFVTDDEEGQLNAEVVYSQEPIFMNTYQASSTSLSFSASKRLEGQTLVEDQFTFELIGAEGNVIVTTKNDKNGQINFEPIQFNEVGQYTFFIRELDEGVKGITYDSTIYEILVEVRDNLEGALQATANLGEQEAVFVNVFVSEEPEEPVEPEDPTDPQGPANPESPIEAEDPTDPESPVEAEDSENKVNSEDSPNEKSLLPQTSFSENQVVYTVIGIILISLSLLIFKKQKGESKD